MSQYPTNPVTPGLPITQQPISVVTNTYAEMPKPVMGGDVLIQEGGYAPPYPQAQHQQPQIGFSQYPNAGQPPQFYNAQQQPPMAMGPYPPVQLQPQIGMAPYPHMEQPGSFVGGPQQFQMQAQPPVQENGLTKIAGSILNQLNPSAFAHSGIANLTGPPQAAPIMPFPPREGIVPGLEILADMDEVLVKQQAEFLEIMSGYETANRYNILNGKGERIYFAGESTDIGALCCGGPNRPFQITIVDFSGRTVLVIERLCDWPLYISNCWICCCCWLGTIGGKASVKLADGTLVGEIIHNFGCYKPKFDIVDTTGSVLMNISGRHCGDCCFCQGGMDQCCATEYPVSLTDGTHLGNIKKKWGGFNNLVSDADNFGVKFPVDLDVKWKALIVGAVFLLDFMYYEQKSEPIKVNN